MMSVTTAWPTRSGAGRVAYLGRRALQMELGVWQSLYRFIFRRPRVPAGARGFSYHQPIMSILVVFIVLSGVEIFVIDLVVHRWAALRIPLLVAGIWGMTWMIGLLFGYLTRPHAVGPAGIRVRCGAEIDIDVPWDAIATVSRKIRNAESSPSQELTPMDTGAVLNLRMQNQTTVDLVLSQPEVVRLPRGQVRVTEIRFFTDDTPGFMAAVRQEWGDAATCA